VVIKYEFLIYLLCGYKLEFKDGIMDKMKIIFLMLLSFFSLLFGQTKLDDNFKNFKGTIVVYDQQSDTYTIFNEKRAAIRYSPFSTYKIPNSIIALEMKVVSDTEQIINWDKQKYPVENWWPETWYGEHNLKSAIKFSVVPVYRHIATIIGDEKMKYYIQGFNYGNKDISSGIDNFWLNGSLKISAFEQIEFLKKFFNSRLNISIETTQLVKSILIQEKTERYKLSAKTGAGYIDQDQNLALGWYVGYLEKDDNVYFFALNIEGRSFSEILEPRIDITKSILKELNIIP